MTPEETNLEAHEVPTEPSQRFGDASSLSSGTRLGQYKILATLGSGGMGEVFRALDTRLGREVAIKILSGSLSPDKAAVSRFEGEARSASALNHPNIVTIYELGNVDSTQYIAMELVDGKTLRELLMTGLIPMHKVIHIASQIADGLARAHEVGIVHRDLKPENIMVRDDGLVKILDFGLAKLYERSTHGISEIDTRVYHQTTPGVVMGTLGYMSPQQATGLSVDFRSDQFSFGLVLYEMVTGKKPLQRASGIATMAALLNEQPEPVGALNPEAPAPLCWAIEHCLAKEPENRYASTGDLARELATIRAHFSELKAERIEAPTNKLPRQLTPFVGRDVEVGALKETLLREDVLLTTITGPGGVGKTRLALKVAEDLIEEFPAGVHFVQLGPVTDAGLVPSLIAQSLHVRAGGHSPLEALKEHLRGSLRKPLLLVLDNFEHLVSVAPMVGELLAIGPHLKILVTSRAPLQIYGENEFPMPPLTLPESRNISVDSMQQYSAVALFVQRAAAVKPDFVLTQDNAEDVIEICTRLDGLPLAIELAASRIKLFQPAALRARLASRLQILTGGSRDLPARQQTLRGAIDWSHDFLNEAEQKLFRRLSVFVGGSNLEQIEAVCDTRNDLGLDLLDGMAALVNQSLIRQIEQAQGETRFDMLETIREYALEKLVASGEEPATRRAHAAYCVILAEEGAAENSEAERAKWFDCFEIEHENLRSALEWLIDNKQVDWGFRLGLALFQFWEAREFFAEGRDRLEKLLKLNEETEPNKERARALFAAGVLAGEQRDYGAAETFMRKSLEISRVLNDKQAVAVALNGLACHAKDNGKIQSARSLFDESLTLWKECDDRLASARSLSNLASVMRLQGEFERSTALYEESLEILKELGDGSGVAWALNYLGDVARDQGDSRKAQEYYEESLVAFKRLGDERGYAGALADLGNLAGDQEDFSLAHSLYRDSLTIFQELDHKRGIARLLDCFACLAAAQADPARSLQLAGAAAALRETFGAALSPAEQATLETKLEPVRRSLTKAAGTAVWLEGWALPMETAVAKALDPVEGTAA